MIYLTVYHLMLNYLLITHFFSVIHDITVSAERLNGDLKKISDWAFQWKNILIQMLVNKLNKLYLVGN